MQRRRALLFAAVLALSAGCDHAVKGVAQSALGDGSRHSLLADTVRFELARNPGAFMSLGAGLPEGVRGVLFLVLLPFVLGVVCLFAARVAASSRLATVGLGLMAGGGIGNWLDRVFQGGTVTDFVSLGAGPLRTGIFNLADLFVLGGAALLVVATGCGPVPGGALRGTPSPLPSDWSGILPTGRGFCEIESRPEKPHSIQLECFVLDGALYVQSHRFALARWWPVESWAAIWIAHPDVRVRLGEKLYDLTAIRVLDPVEREKVLRHRGYDPAPAGIVVFRFERRTQS